MSTPEPQRCLAAADDMLRGAGVLGLAAVAGGWWPKACACLIRLALESGMDAYWQRVSPPVARYGNGRTKLLMLRQRMPRDVARHATYTWVTLSRATHHHCYESAPTVAELRGLHAAVVELLAQFGTITSPVACAK